MEQRNSHSELREYKVVKNTLEDSLLNKSEAGISSDPMVPLLGAYPKILRHVRFRRQKKEKVYRSTVKF